MSLTERGLSLQTNLINLGRDVWDWGDNGLTIRRTFKTAYVNWVANVIAKGEPHPLVPQCLLTRIQVQQGSGGNPHLCLVQLTFEQDSPMNIGSESAELPPPTRYTDNSDAVRISIFDSPYFASLRPPDDQWTATNRTLELLRSWAQTGDNGTLLTAMSAADDLGEPAKTKADELVGYISRGVTEVYASTFSVTKTEFSASEFAAPTDRVAKREDPGGDYGNAGQWLITACFRSKEGPWHTRNTVYQHSAEEIPALYPEA